MKKLLTIISAALILACGCTTSNDAIIKVNDEVIEKVKGVLYKHYILPEDKNRIKDAIKTVIFKFNELRNTIEHRTISKIDNDFSKSSILCATLKSFSGFL